LVIKVLAIGDVGNVMATLRKYTKKSEIYLINFPKDGSGTYSYEDNVELFKTWKVSEHVKRINEIKDHFDICVTMGTGERIAYLADLNFIAYYVGRDIDAPRFVKNAKEDWYKEKPIHKLNFLERKFYRYAFDFAIEYVAGTWVYDHLKKYTNKGIRMDRNPVDSAIFNEKGELLDRKKTKFTFFSPQRMGHPKGTHLIWEALPMCKSDFEVIQVEWYGKTQEEEIRLNKELSKNIPSQVKFVPMIKRKDMPKYYRFADAVLGHFNPKIFIPELVECEAALCKKPVIQYVDPNKTVIIDGKKITPPFKPNSMEPKIIAETIDMIVESKEFREKLAEDEYNFVKEFNDPEKIIEWWEDLFEKCVQNHKSIRRNSSKFRILCRYWLFLIANRLYFKKLKRLFIKKEEIFAPTFSSKNK